MAERPPTGKTRGASPVTAAKLPGDTDEGKDFYANFAN